MGELVNFITPLHKKSQRNYIERMTNDKAHCMGVAKRYEYDYWDGDRKYGYGGYTYRPGYWEPVATALIDRYKLGNSSKVLDVGCGKAFLLHEMRKLLPGLTVRGVDVSQHGISHAQPEIKPFLSIQKAQDRYPFLDHEFDLVISITTLHNLRVFELKTALQEIARVGKRRYIAVESFRSDLELFNLECWALTCAAFFTPEEWIWLYKEFGCECDYEFIYFE
ncbi:MAG: class I SAM-dependent methyltransferase [Candidatus Brocadiia bacterium]